MRWLNYDWNYFIIKIQDKIFDYSASFFQTELVTWGTWHFKHHPSHSGLIQTGKRHLTSNCIQYLKIRPQQRWKPRNLQCFGMLRSLTVRNTDASSRMTEYTSPLLLMKTCKKNKCHNFTKTHRSEDPKSLLWDTSHTHNHKRHQWHKEERNGSYCRKIKVCAYWWSVVHHKGT